MIRAETIIAVFVIHICILLEYSMIFMPVKLRGLVLDHCASITTRGKTELLNKIEHISHLPECRRCESPPTASSDKKDNWPDGENIYLISVVGHAREPCFYAGKSITIIILFRLLDLVSFVSCWRVSYTAFDTG